MPRLCGCASVATPLCSLRFGVSASVPSPPPAGVAEPPGYKSKRPKTVPCGRHRLARQLAADSWVSMTGLIPVAPLCREPPVDRWAHHGNPCAAAVWRKEGRTASADRPTDRDGVALRHVVVRPAGMPRHPYRNRTTHLLEDKCSQGKRVLCSPLLSRPATERVNRATPEWVKPARASDE